MDRATDYGSVGWGFDSSWARLKFSDRIRKDNVRLCKKSIFHKCEPVKCTIGEGSRVREG